MKKLKKSLGLKILALCVASAGFMCVKSSMLSVEVYAMEDLQNMMELEYNRIPDLREDFGKLNSLWRGDDENNAIDEIENLLTGRSANIEVIKDAVNQVCEYLNKYRDDRVKDWTFSCWGDLMLLGGSYPNVVIDDQEVIASLRNLYNYLIDAGVMEDSEEFNLSFIPQGE